MTALLAKALVIATVIYAPCPGDPVRDGCAYRDWNVVYLNPHALEPMRRVETHELGHIVDYSLLTDQDRGTFLALTHDPRPWESPPNSPHERFAEAVWLCARSARWPPNVPAMYGYHPTVVQHRKVCRWLTSIGQRPS